jgi:hypothetical protein
MDNRIQLFVGNRAVLQVLAERPVLGFLLLRELLDIGEVSLESHVSAFQLTYHTPQGSRVKAPKGLSREDISPPRHKDTRRTQKETAMSAWRSWRPWRFT